MIEKELTFFSGALGPKLFLRRMCLFLKEGFTEKIVVGLAYVVDTTSVLVDFGLVRFGFIVRRFFNCQDIQRLKGHLFLQFLFSSPNNLPKVAVGDSALLFVLKHEEESIFYAVLVSSLDVFGHFRPLFAIFKEEVD